MRLCRKVQIVRFHGGQRWYFDFTKVAELPLCVDTSGNIRRTGADGIESAGFLRDSNDLLRAAAASTLG